MLKSYGVGVGARVYGVGARVYGSLVILVSAQGPNPSFFFFWGTFIQLGTCLDKGLDSDLDKGLTINTTTDPDNSSHVLVYYNARSGWAVGLESIGVSKLLYL